MQATRKLPKVMKVVRRTHLYLGLFLFPWVAFFGLSGILFNHPNIGVPMERSFVPPEQLKALTGLEPLDTRGLAEELAQTLSATTGLSLSLAPGSTPSLSGWAVFQAAAPGGRHIMLVDLEGGALRIATRPAGPAPEAAPFHGVRVDVSAPAMGQIADGMTNVLASLNKEALGPPVTNLGRAPKVSFTLVDEGGQSYNVIYSLGTRKVEARRTDSVPQLGLNHALAVLHKTHHFPVDLGPTFWWALLADLTGLTLIIWALTGLAMWWQMKKLRLGGLVVLVAGLVLAGLVFWAVLSEKTFGNVRAPGGPGGPPPVTRKS